MTTTTEKTATKRRPSIMESPKYKQGYSDGYRDGKILMLKHAMTSAELATEPIPVIIKGKTFINFERND